MYIRQQCVVYLTDLAPEFLEAFIDTWGALGIEASRVFSVGA